MVQISVQNLLIRVVRSQDYSTKRITLSLFTVTVQYIQSWTTVLDSLLNRTGSGGTSTVPKKKKLGHYRSQVSSNFTDTGLSGY